MHRRLFLQTLAASVAAVGAPLPVGFPTEPMMSQHEMLWKGWAQRLYNEYTDEFNIWS